MFAVWVEIHDVRCRRKVSEWPESEQEQSCKGIRLSTANWQAGGQKQGGLLSRDPARPGPVTLRVRESGGEKREGSHSAVLGRCASLPQPWKITEHLLKSTLRAKKTVLYTEFACKVVWLFCNHGAHG